MVSNSSTHLCSQSSIKSFVDNSVLFDTYTTASIPNISNKDQSSQRYFKFERNTNANDCGFWIRTIESSTPNNAYIFLTSDTKLNFQIDSEIIKYFNTNIQLQNSQNGNENNEKEKQD